MDIFIIALTHNFPHEHVRNTYEQINVLGAPARALNTYILKIPFTKHVRLHITSYHFSCIDSFSTVKKKNVRPKPYHLRLRKYARTTYTYAYYTHTYCKTKGVLTHTHTLIQLHTQWSCSVLRIGLCVSVCGCVCEMKIVLSCKMQIFICSPVYTATHSLYFHAMLYICVLDVYVMCSTYKNSSSVWKCSHPLLS